MCINLHLPSDAVAYSYCMKPWIPHKILFFSLLVLLGILCGVFGMVFMQTFRQYNVFRSREISYQKALEKSQENFQMRRKYLECLLSDSEFFEHVVRQRLGYSRPDELIFRFEKNDL